MLDIFRKTAENERKEDNSRLGQDKFNKSIEQFNTKQEGLNNGVNRNETDLRCEEAIMKEKERFGRVRNSLMKYLRAEYSRVQQIEPFGGSIREGLKGTLAKILKNFLLADLTRIQNHAIDWQTFSFLSASPTILSNLHQL